ncbi:hypothetical protein HOD83_00380 [Candidatus Woesearchaeota archaeon]|jgi:Flp pilus assembly protein TadB|nr:hypothetical protein [Candidatus Woesearchaeota archaeon]MBT4248033.1 hypothetical protein [Candidatus Woesearchaeota archaeon]
MVDLDKYRRELDKELDGKQEIIPDQSYSTEYRQFIKDQDGSGKQRYARACRKAGNLLHVHISQKDFDRLNPYLKLLHLNISPQNVMSLSYLSAIVMVLLSIIAFALTLNFMVLIGGMISSVVVMYMLSKAPSLMFKSWRAKASDQLVSAVLYMVIYMEHTSNLEQAVYFAARNLPPPLSLDFIRVLWLVESGKYATIGESLESYVKTWESWNPGFAEAVHMLESSLYVNTATRRHEILERTVNTILDSTERSMMKYAHDTQNPVQAVHMLGIILPVMGLVMLPLIVSFMGDQVSIWKIVFLYNVLLPISVFLLAKHTLDTRPAGVNTNDIYDFYNYKNYRTKIRIGKRYISISPKLAAVVVALLFFIGPIMHFSNMYSDPDTLNLVANSLLTLGMSLLIIGGLGFGLATYYYLRVKDLIPRQKQLNKLDTEFSNSVFQLGNRLEEGIPIESAFRRVAESMPKSPIAALFNKIQLNLVQGNMGLKQAIFDPHTGALVEINSAMIRSVMNIIVEGSKKGSKIVAFSLITISRYMTSIRNVNERLKDLLAETIASLRSEVKIFIPMISGIVVAMAVLTTNILISLSDRLADISSVGGSNQQLGFGSTLMDIFQLEHLIPSWVFQLVVGIYLIQVTLVMSYMLSGILHGSQRVERSNVMQRNLFMSTTVYIVITLVMSMIFVMLTQGVGGRL